ncbi:DUF4190 domain-containing protein [Arthrobacter sp. LAPM80]|uniref:DUF4190 domain-containing protein n=1 Tax=Arthrobacter sp. LAPM80 TaxID=3141788 RepID=UPI00398AD6C9
MSNEPEQPQPNTGRPPSFTPAGYNAPAAPPAYQVPQYAPPTYYKGGPGYIDATSGPRSLSLTSMILGLASLLVGFGILIVPQILGIVLGHMGLRKENPQGRAFAITGLITSYLALVIWGALYAFILIGLAVMGTNAYSSY